ncbi:MAG: M48 family metallopeptidase [Betaproteobacteria bacterium]|jgi:predicted Zn-dependent protease|nr:M48 family metallopeptidase [Betaproteobacteria bacterium]
MKRSLLALAVVAALGAGCQTVDTTKAGAVGVERQQRMALSSEQVNAEAQKAYAQMMGQAQQKGALDKDAAQVARVKAIVSRLIPQTAAFRDDAPKWAWETHVLTTDEVNAWCMPGGKIAVYTGLLNKVQPTDDELAAVLGHEMGHALREHTREQMSQQAITQTAIGGLGALLGIGDLGQSLAGAVANVTMELPKSRGMEKEADDIGVELAARAGYNPQASVSLWQKMEKVAGGSEPPKFLSTHPPSADRVADLQKQIEKVMPLYQQAKAGGAAAAGK